MEINEIRPFFVKAMHVMGKLNYEPPPSEEQRRHEDDFTI